MSSFSVGLAIIAALVLLLGLFSEPIKRRWLSEPMLSMGVGILIGVVLGGGADSGLGSDPRGLLEPIARLTLAVGVMGAALRLPKNFFLHQWRTLARLIGAMMPVMWLASSAVFWILLGWPMWVALLAGAVVTPTDPVLAGSIVTGRITRNYVPSTLRSLLTGESGANDGMAYPFVFLPILFLAHERTGAALTEWFTRILLWDVVLAALAGCLMGYLASRLLEWAETKLALEPTSYLAYTVSLSLLVVSLCELIGSSGILAVFAAGVTFNAGVPSEERKREERVQEAVNRFFILPVFLLFGLVLPWGKWAEMGWTAGAIVAAIILLRRVPGMLASSHLYGLRGMKDALFVGWFGPIGVAAIYYGMVSLRVTGQSDVWTVASLVIFGSVLVHGITATPFAQLYGSKR